MTRFMQTPRKAATARRVHPAGLEMHTAFHWLDIRADISAIKTVADMTSNTDLWVGRLSHTGTITAFHKAGKIRIVKKFVKKLATAAQSNQVYTAKDAHLLTVVGRTMAHVPNIPGKIKGAIAAGTKRTIALQKNL